VLHSINPSIDPSILNPHFTQQPFPPSPLGKKKERESKSGKVSSPAKINPADRQLLCKSHVHVFAMIDLSPFI
jgi:hypothetical protein